MNINQFDNPQQLNEHFSQRIVALLADGIKTKGRASLLVSGGRTPVALFEVLSNAELDWSKVDISLADERWVDEQDDASNARLVRQHLLQNKAAAANFVSLKSADSDAEQAIDEISRRVAAISQPFDVLILGMGEDGHTASLFPCSEQLDRGLDMHSGQQVVAVTPTTAPHQRMSLTLPALLSSQHIFLHLVGDSKKQVLQQALDGNDQKAMPIRAVLHNANVNLMWCA